MAIFKIQITKSKSGKKVKEERDVRIETGMEFSGSASALTDAELDARRLFGLPTTKDLVYYPSTREDNRISVDKFIVDQIFSISEPWFSLMLCMGEDTVKIHHRFFVEMQSPTFISDMNKGSMQE